MISSNINVITLSRQHYDEIYQLIRDHYIEDDISRIYYHRDFIYWYLQQAPEKFIVGVTYGSKLLGVAFAILLDFKIHDVIYQIPHLNFVCLQKKIRGHGFGKLLCEKIMTEMTRDFKAVIYTHNKIHSDDLLLRSASVFVIPINYEKLRNIQFIPNDLEMYPVVDSNPLHTVKTRDISSICSQLNDYMSKYTIRPFFTKEAFHNLLTCRKNISYAFCKYSHGQVTDYINVYVNNIYCIEHNTTLTVAHLAFYFHNTLTLTELVIYLINKLAQYGIDQLFYRDIGDNHRINVMHFTTNDVVKYYGHGFFQLGALNSTNKEAHVINPISIYTYPF